MVCFGPPPEMNWACLTNCIVEAVLLYSKTLSVLLVKGSLKKKLHVLKSVLFIFFIMERRVLLSREIESKS